jgi:hypothetical protein
MQCVGIADRYFAVQDYLLIEHRALFLSYVPFPPYPIQFTYQFGQPCCVLVEETEVGKVRMFRIELLWDLYRIPNDGEAVKS